VNERGFASVMLVSLLALAALLCLVTADAANVLVSRSRAQSAADAAALAAATAEWPFTGEKQTPEQAATDAAQANGATLVSCTCPLRGPTAHVEVQVPTRIRMLGVAPSKVNATAEAKLDIDRIFAPQR
jgi:secretion/DNA translocation related TadE-like protein